MPATAHRRAGLLLILVLLLAVAAAALPGASVARAGDPPRSLDEVHDVIKGELSGQKAFDSAA
jgi:hypothetical protein